VKYFSSSNLAFTLSPVSGSADEAVGGVSGIATVYIVDAKAFVQCRRAAMCQLARDMLKRRGRAVANSVERANGCNALDIF